MTTPKIEPPEGYRLMREDERPDKAKGDLVQPSPDCAWFLTECDGAETVEEVNEGLDEECDALSYARRKDL